MSTTFSMSEYRKRKADRLLKIRPQWFENPETSERFFLRPVRAVMSSLLAGSLPSGLTNEAIKAWKDKGVPGMDDKSVQEIVADMTPEQLEDSVRETQRLSLIIQEACVIPLLSNDPPHKIAFSDGWKAQAIEGLKEIDPDFTLETFNPADFVLDPRDLDEKDSRWLFKWAAGLVLDVPLKGGGAVPMDDLSRFRKVPGRLSRARADGGKVRKTAE